MRSADDPIATKLAAARTRLILDKPFLGALVLRLPLEPAPADWCPTTATDARALHFNPDYIAGLSLEQTQFVLAHEALHCALAHFARRGHRQRHRWDIACDFAINPLLVDDGLAPPPEALLLDDYRGLTAEEIYPLLDDCESLETQDQHLYDDDNPSTGDTPDSASGEPNQTDHDSPGADGSGGGGRPPPLTAQEREDLAVQWRQRLAGAAQQAMQAGKLEGTMARLVDHLLQPQLPWRQLLARYVTARARDDFSYMRPSRREGNAVLPSLRSAQVQLVVAVDTSGSIHGDELDEFLSEVTALKGQIRARVTLLACDSEIAAEAPWEFEPWEPCRLPPSLDGGGGTDFRPVFEFVDQRDTAPDLLIYFTDAEGGFPERPPGYPVIWLVKGRATVPWGERIQLN